MRIINIIFKLKKEKLITNIEIKVELTIVYL